MERVDHRLQDLQSVPLTPPRDAPETLFLSAHPASLTQSPENMIARRRQKQTKDDGYILGKYETLFHNGQQGKLFKRIPSKPSEGLSRPSGPLPMLLDPSQGTRRSRELGQDTSSNWSSRHLHWDE